MTKDEALKLALEALEADPLEMVADVDGHMVFLKDKAITAVKEALAQEQEPLAWGVFDDNLHDMFFAKEEAQEMVRLKGDGSTVKPLYTTPPQREFVGLTDEEINILFKNSLKSIPAGVIWNISRTIEAKLKEKNT